MDERTTGRPATRRMASAVVLVCAVLAACGPEADGLAASQESVPVLTGPAWVSRGAVHLGDVRRPLPLQAVGLDSGVQQLGVVATGAVVRAYPSENIEIFRLSRRVMVVAAEPGGPPVGDPRGALVAWTETTGSEVDLVVADTETGRVVARRAIEMSGEALDMLPWAPPVLAVERDTVVYESAGAVWSLHVGTGVTTRTGHSAEGLIDVAAGVDAVSVPPTGRGRSGAGWLTRVTLVGPDSTVHVRQPLSDDGKLSPDGRWLAASDHRYRLVVLDTRTGRPVRLPGTNVPVAGTPAPYGWNPDGTLTVGMYQRETRHQYGTYFLVCDIPRSTCERLPDTARWPAPT